MTKPLTPEIKRLRKILRAKIATKERVRGIFGKASQHHYDEIAKAQANLDAATKS